MLSIFTQMLAMYLLTPFAELPRAQIPKPQPDKYNGYPTTKKKEKKKQNNDKAFTHPRALNGRNATYMQYCCSKSVRMLAPEIDTFYSRDPAFSHPLILEQIDQSPLCG